MPLSGDVTLQELIATNRSKNPQGFKTDAPLFHTFVSPETAATFTRRGTYAFQGAKMLNGMRGVTTALIITNAIIIPSGGSAQDVQLVQSGTISTAVNETFPMIDPVDGSLWFSRYERSFGAQTIWRAPRDGSGWGEAHVAPFSGSWGDRAPRFSHDGTRLYFTSNRPQGDAESPGQFHIWQVDRRGGAWSEPVHLQAPVNVDGAPSIHLSVGSDGTLWVPSARPGGFGRSDIYRIAPSEMNGGTAERVGPPINDDRSQPDVLIAPDGSWMILAVTDHPEGYGGDDLWLSRRVNGAWTPPTNLGPAINSEEYEYGPSLSPDGVWLYFNSHRTGPSNIYRVRLASVLHRIVRGMIEAEYESYVRAYATADSRALAAVYDLHGARLSTNGRVAQGRAAIRQSVGRFLEAVGSVDVVIEIVDFWVVDDFVYETGLWSYSYVREGDEITSGGRYVTAWRKQSDGGWKIWADLSVPGTSLP